MAKRLDSCVVGGESVMFPDKWRAGALRPKGGELTIDLFCGGGGASAGLERATRCAVDIAINHSKDAIYYHEMNHPGTQHKETDVFDLHPLHVTKGRPVGLLWLSPDCTHFSKAKNSTPKSKNIRSLANVGLWYARHAKPRVIALENVEEFLTWGRLDKRTGQPDRRKSGEDFQKFVRRLRQHGYAVEWRVLKACDYGAPTIRKRLFLLARCDGEAIVWPKATHGPKRRKPYRTAAECIDFSLPSVSIFATPEEVKAAGLNARRPLADNSMARIGRGVWKFVINNPKPFVIAIDNQSSGSAEYPIDEPLRSITSKNRFALVSPFLAKHYTGVTGSDLRQPLGTVTGVDHHSLVCCHIEQQNSQSNGQDIDDPLTAITAQGQHHALVTNHLMSYHSAKGSESRCHPMTEPLPTFDTQNRFAEVRAFLIKYYGQGVGQELDRPLDTITGQDRFGLVTIYGQDYRIVDICLRMLTPEELLRAQFGDYADGYRIDGLSKRVAVRMIGNSVCPDMAYAIAKANYRRRLRAAA